MSLPDHARYIHYHSIPNCPGCVKNFGTGIVCLTGATGSLLPVSARAGNPSVAPKRYHYQNFGQAGLGGSVTLSAAKSPHRRVAGTRPRVFAPKGRRNVATGGVPACRDGTRGHFVRMYSRPGWGGGSSIAAHAIQRWSIPRPPTGPAVPWGLAPTGSARACRPSLHPWQQSSAPFGAAESVTGSVGLEESSMV
jgi:hypothetical protein